MSGRFAQITRLSDSRESPDSRESCESIRANHATKHQTVKAVMKAARRYLDFRLFCRFLTILGVASRNLSDAKATCLGATHRAIPGVDGKPHDGFPHFQSILFSSRIGVVPALLCRRTTTTFLRHLVNKLRRTPAGNTLTFLARIGITEGAVAIRMYICRVRRYWSWQEVVHPHQVINTTFVMASRDGVRQLVLELTVLHQL